VAPPRFGRGWLGDITVSPSLGMGCRTRQRDRPLGDRRAGPADVSLAVGADRVGA